MKSGGGWVLLIYQNATVRVYGAWIGIYYVLCSKTYSTFGAVFCCPVGSQRDARGTRICETVRTIGTIKNAHCLWWSDPEKSVCLLDYKQCNMKEIII